MFACKCVIKRYCGHALPSDNEEYTDDKTARDMVKWIRAKLNDILSFIIWRWYEYIVNIQNTTKEMIICRDVECSVNIECHPMSEGRQKNIQTRTTGHD